MKKLPVLVWNGSAFAVRTFWGVLTCTSHWTVPLPLRSGVWHRDGELWFLSIGWQLSGVSAFSDGLPRWLKPHRALACRLYRSECWLLPGLGMFPASAPFSQELNFTRLARAKGSWPVNLVQMSQRSRGPVLERGEVFVIWASWLNSLTFWHLKSNLFFFFNH